MVDFRVTFLFAVMSVFAMRTLQRHNIKKIMFIIFVNVIMKFGLNVVIKTSRPSVELSYPRELHTKTNDAGVVRFTNK